MFGSAIALTDTMVHHQDICRALGHQRTAPEERLVAALTFPPHARALPAPANVRNLRLVATDVDWSHGTGPEVNGLGEALLEGKRPQCRSSTTRAQEGLGLLLK